MPLCVHIQTYPIALSRLHQRVPSQLWQGAARGSWRGQSSTAGCQNGGTVLWPNYVWPLDIGKGNSQIGSYKDRAWVGALCLVCGGSVQPLPNTMQESCLQDSPLWVGLIYLSHKHQSMLSNKILLRRLNLL